MKSSLKDKNWNSFRLSLKRKTNRSNHSNKVSQDLKVKFKKNIPRYLRLKIFLVQRKMSSNNSNRNLKPRNTQFNKIFQLLGLKTLKLKNFRHNSLIFKLRSNQNFYWSNPLKLKKFKILNLKLLLYKKNSNPKNLHLNQPTKNSCHSKLNWLKLKKK